MKLTDAYWERKNTSERVCEILFEKGETAEQYPAESIAGLYDYVVAKIPAGSTALVHELEEIGFRYLETQFSIAFDIKENLELNDRWREKVSRFSFTPATSQEEVASIMMEIGRGIFLTDRVAIDPYWSTEVAANRYQNWLRQLLNDGKTEIYTMRNASANETGFFSVREESNHICSCPLAGIYKSYIGKGYFLPLTLGFFHTSYSLGYRKMITSISSNNRAIHRFFSKLFLYTIDNSMVVLRKVVTS